MLYLIIISLLLHLISFMVIILLYQRIENQKPLDKEQTLKEMEDLLISYTAEMKDNNERLARRLSGMAAPGSASRGQFPPPGQNDVTSSDDEGVQTEHVKDKQHTAGSVKPDFPDKSSSANSDDVYDSYKPPLPDDDLADQPVETSDTSKVLSLSKQGYSEAEIARKLNMGAGEVALLLKFYK